MSQYLISRIERSPRITLYTDTEIERLEGTSTLEFVTWTNRKTGQTTRKPIGTVFVMIGAEPDLNSRNYRDFVKSANRLLMQKLHLPAGYSYKWAGEYEFELRAKERLQIILPVVFFVIFVLLYMVFHSLAESAVLIFPTLYALTGGLILQKLLGYNFSVAVWVGYIALFGIAVETGVVMVVYLHEALNRRLASGRPLRHEDIEEAVIEGAVHRLRPKLMTVCVVLASLIPILWESGIGSDVMKPIAAPLVGGMITSTIHVLILVPVFFALMKESALRRGTLQLPDTEAAKD